MMVGGGRHDGLGGAMPIGSDGTAGGGLPPDQAGDRCGSGRRQNGIESVDPGLALFRAILFT